jgi:16S rRNA (guanine(527)-N(7))-methyltransferase RsmG
VRRRGRPSSGRRAELEPAAAGARLPGGRGPQDPGQTLRDAAAALGLALPPAFLTQIDTYLEELERWQRIGSLTAYRDRAARVRHLVVESLMLLAALPEPASPLLDIGTGPGVPGLILKLARPDWEVVLIEAAQRRTNFLRHVVRQLGLEGVSIVWGRAEALASGALAGRFRTVTMRAVAAGDAARALALPFLAPEGALALPLGPKGTPRGGTRREITLAAPGELPWRRQFLIIPRTELDAGVPRGTKRAAGSLHRSREPEGRRREDHDGR